MFERLFANKNHVRIRALLVGDRLDLRTLKTAEQLAAQPLTVPVATAQFAGGVVYCDFNRDGVIA
jgi:hypothetical protein